MKIIVLNTWGGHRAKPLLEFIGTRASDTDVFLFQEVFHQGTEKTVWDDGEAANLFQDMSEHLPDHRGYFAPSVVHEWGLAAFVKESIPVEGSGDVFVHKNMEALEGRDGSSIGRNLQYLHVRSTTGTLFTVLNFHGMWTGTGKNDTEERLAQSRKIVEFVKTLSGPVALCGDFNLLPETESIRMIPRELGLKNLIEDYGITSTRTSIYTKPHKFADYVFVSPTLTVNTFCVLPDEVSDHAPLLLEFST